MPLVIKLINVYNISQQPLRESGRTGIKWFIERSGIGSEPEQGGKMNNLNTRRIVFTAVMIAIMLVMNILGIGLIRIPPINATTLHVPVVIATLIGGLWMGIPAALAFGLMSLYNAVTAPTILSPFIVNPVICIGARLCIALVTYGFMRLLRYDPVKPNHFKTVLLGFIGSMTNTVLVLGLIWLIYIDKAAQAMGLASEKLGGALFSIATVSGIPEAAICALICAALVAALSKTPYIKMLQKG